jgi:dihydrofolate reductase
MLNEQKISFVSIIDNNSMMMPHLKTRIWHHQKLVNNLLENEVCIFGRRTFEITRWKGPNSWVMTSDRSWRRTGVGTIHDFDDLHLHTEGDVYVLGGISLFKQFEPYVDEIHLYVLNGTDGKEPWIDIHMRDWKPMAYTNKGLWSYGHLRKIKNVDPHDLNKELFDF